MDSQSLSKIIASKAVGIPERVIANQIGCSQQRVNQLSNKPDIQKEIKAIQEKFYQDNLSQAVENFHILIHSNPEDKQDKYLKYRASEKVLDSAGVTGGSTPSIFIQQIFNQQNNQIVSPLISDVLDKFLTDYSNNNEENSLDAEVKEEP